MFGFSPKMIFVSKMKKIFVGKFKEEKNNGHQKYVVWAMKRNVGRILTKFFVMGDYSCG